MANPPPDKHELMLKLLEHGSVFMHLDPRREGVVVPLHFRSNPQLVLQIGLNFPIPIRDLEIDAEGCAARSRSIGSRFTASFRGRACTRSSARTGR
ncbi:MAG: hypothetical protein U0269_09025 [Polyangiales bacterium]